MINLNILLVDNCSVDIEKAKKPLFIFSVETNLFFAENDL
jgi:hypothetical protein